MTLTRTQVTIFNDLWCVVLQISKTATVLAHHDQNAKGDGHEHRQICPTHNAAPHMAALLALLQLFRFKLK